MVSDEDFLTTAREARILLSILARMSEHSLERHLATQEVPISGLQLGVMRSLMREEQTISDLSRIFVLDPSTLVPVVDSLERKQLILRRRDPNDRRRVPLTMTERGRQLVGSIPLLDDGDPLIQGLTALGKERTEAFLNQLRELMKTLPKGEAILAGVQARMHSPAHDDLNPHRPEGGPKCWGMYSQNIRRRPYRRRSGTV